MSDARPHDEDSEVEALTEQDEVQEGASPDAQDDAAAPTLDGDSDDEHGVDAGSSAQEQPADAGTGDAGTDDAGTDDTGQDVEDAGTGTADTTDDPQLDAPD